MEETKREPEENTFRETDGCKKAEENGAGDGAARGCQETENGAVSGCKRIEDGVVGGYKKIEDGVVGGYKKIEDGVVGGYKKIEDSVVRGFGKITDKFVGSYLTREGENVEEAKARLAAEQEQRKAQSEARYSDSAKGERKE